LTVAVDLRKQPPAQHRSQRTICHRADSAPGHTGLAAQKARRLLIAKQSAARARAEVVGSGTTPRLVHLAYYHEDSDHVFPYPLG